MKKLGIALLLSLHLCTYCDHANFLQRIRKQTKISKFTISSVHIEQDHISRFDSEYRTFIATYKPFYRLLEDLYSSLVFYSKQPTSYQIQYRNVAPINSLIKEIKQKDLTIAITKLLQYKTTLNNPPDQEAMTMITDLKKLIHTIQLILTKLASSKDLFVPFADNPSEKIARITVADYFKDFVSKRLFFKIKKIKRSITNWENKQT